MPCPSVLAVVMSSQFLVNSLISYGESMLFGVNNFPLCTRTNKPLLGQSETKSDGVQPPPLRSNPIDRNYQINIVSYICL